MKTLRVVAIILRKEKMSFGRWLIGLCVLVLSSTAHADDRVFTLPYEDLKVWADNITISLDEVTILGHSGVHAVKSDCEMHLGASVKGYAGEPAGWVLEPMNVCIAPLKGQKYSKKEWLDWGNSLTRKKVKVEGVPRIWPEHLRGGNEDSNPNHAMELHPLTRLIVGNKTYNFSKSIFPPEGFPGGLSTTTAQHLLEELEVTVTASNDGLVEVDFQAGRIGNFSTLDLRIAKQSIKQAPGGHQMEGEVVIDRAHAIPVHLVTVAGSAIDGELEKDISSSMASALHFEGLVLFSLNPQALFAAAEKSNGQPIRVEQPIELILYGEIEAE